MKGLGLSYPKILDADSAEVSSFRQWWEFIRYVLMYQEMGL